MFLFSICLSINSSTGLIKLLSLLERVQYSYADDSFLDTVTIIIEIMLVVMIMTSKVRLNIIQILQLELLILIFENNLVVIKHPVCKPSF